ncbi:MAG TPA: SpoIIE family protein phosphatase, partial [Bacteroidota bacterium]|nr:SpoIIE family protein phosphatase [Bacteroidota bacterium]
MKVRKKKLPPPHDPEFERRFDFHSLFEFSSIINGSTDLSFILGHLLLTIMGKILALRGMVLLGGEDTSFRVRTVRGLKPDLIGSEFVIRKIPRKITSVASSGAKRSPWMKYFRSHGLETIIPMTEGDRIVGLVGFAPSQVRDAFTTGQKEYLTSLANIAATSIVRATAYREVDVANRELNRKIQELNTLFELSKELNAVLDPERMVKLLMFSVMGQIGAHKCFLSLRRGESMVHVLNRVDGEIPAALSPYFLGLGEPRIVDTLTRPADRPARKLLAGLGIEAVIPLRSQNELKGVFGVGGRMNDRPYSRTDMEFLSSLGNLAVIALDNARLFREALEKQKLEDELLIAREIQQALLPAALPNLGGYSMAAANISSRQVGGDYYDVIPLGGDRWVVAIGDVSGKGTPASLLMASLQASIRALVPLEMSLSDLTRRVNDLMVQNTSQGRFITFFWGILDQARSTFTYVNAGHNPPVLCRAGGTLERLEAGGLILGVMRAGGPYEQATVEFFPGDTLCLYTDGVSEAM